MQKLVGKGSDNHQLFFITIFIFIGSWGKAQTFQNLFPQFESQYNYMDAPIKIMPLGDSITEGGYNLNGNYYSDGGGYRLQLGRELSGLLTKTEFVGSLENGPQEMMNRHHEGHSGWRIDQIAESVAGWLVANKPDIILLQIGTNDFIQGYKTSEALMRLENLVTAIRKQMPQAKLLVSTITLTNNPFLNRQIYSFNKDIKKNIAQLEKSDSFVHPVETAFLDYGDFTDGVHPTTAAYMKIAEVWFNALKSLDAFQKIGN